MWTLEEGQHDMKLVQEEIQKQLLNALLTKIKVDDLNAYVITQNNAIEIFKTLNELVFGNKLPKTPIYVEKYDKNTMLHGFNIGEFKVDIDSKDIELFKKTFSLNGLRLKHCIRIINIGKINFESMLVVFLHEMIHEYDYFYGLGKTGMLVNFFDRVCGKKPSYDTHGTYFKEQAKRIQNETGMQITQNFNDVLSTKKIETQLSTITESDSFSTNGCVDNITLKLAKMIRAALKDDGTNRVEISKDGSITLTIS